MSAFFSLLIARRAELLDQFIVHMNMTTLAVFISLLIGVPLGILITKNKRAASLVIGLANLMQSIPCIALLAFSVPFVGIGTTPAIIMVVVYALLPIIKNTYTGISSIDPKLLEASRGIGLSKWQRLVKVQLPIAAPFIMAGIRISAVTAVGTMTIAAFAGAGGLGWFINLGLSGNNPSMVMLGAIPASLMALLIDFILSKLEQVVTPEGIKAPEEIHVLPRKKLIARRVGVFSLCGVLVLFPVVTSAAEAIGRNHRVVTVATSYFTESYTVGYIYTELIEANTDIEVEKKFNLNNATIALESLKNNDVNMYMDYTGTALSNFVHQPMDTDPERVYNTVKEQMYEDYQILTSKPLGYNNTYVMSVKPETADRYSLKTLSDLVRKSGSLHLGCTTEFIQREDCLPALEAAHQVKFKKVSALEGNIRYQAIAAGNVEVVDAFSTDALLVKEGLIPLTDDLQFFPPYYAVNFVTESTFEEYPELEPLLAKLEGAISEAEMRQMNYQVDVEGRDSQAVAHEFLVAKGLVPD